MSALRNLTPGEHGLSSSVTFEANLRRLAPLERRVAGEAAWQHPRAKTSWRMLGKLVWARESSSEKLVPQDENAV